MRCVSRRFKKIFGSKKEDAAGSLTSQHVKHKGKASQDPPTMAPPPTQPPRVTEKACQENVVEQKLPAEGTAQDGDHEEQDRCHDLWAQAFRQLERREAELAADYLKHINTFYGGDGSVSKSLVLDVHAAEPVIGQLLATREKKQWSIHLFDKDIKIRAQVEKLAKFCLFADEIVKQALSNQSSAALAWSAVSILLPLINSGKTQHDSMLGGFDYIGEVQLYWKIYQESHPPTQPLQDDIRQALVELYSRIVEYQARVICHLSSAQLSRSWEKMSGSIDWIGQKQSIAEKEQHCSRLVSVSDRAKIQEQRDVKLREIQESREILEQVRAAIDHSVAQAEKRHRDDKEGALLQDLSSNYEQFKNVNPEKVPRTCEWFFQDDDFREWRARETSSLLWVSASPGCGKSVLSRALVDENRLSNNAATTIVCYFFFKTEVNGQMDSASALAALIHQLLVQDPTGQMFLKGLESHRKHGYKLREKSEELWRMLIACASSYPSGEIIVVLDALDECGEESREKLLQALDSILSHSAQNTRLKFLVTSRPYDDVYRAFRGHTKKTGCFRVDGDEKSVEIGSEIDIVIDAKVAEFAQDFSEADCKAIADRLKGMQNRTYLWLHLTFNIIKKRKTFFSKASSIQKLLDSIPTDLSDAYEEILKHLSDDPEDRALTRALLELVLAATRPLTLDEANYALTLATDGREFSSQAEINEQLWKDDFKSVVKNLSGLLITVCDSRLSFIHLTVREFLTDVKKKGQWRGCLTMEDSHSTMAWACVDYLVAVDPGTLEGDMNSLAEGFPFLNYSLLNWFSHYNCQREDDQQKLSARSRKLCNTAGRRGLKLVALYYQVGIIGRDRWDNRLSSELHIACALGLKPVVASILEEMGVTSEAFIRIYRVALVAAACQGHPDIVRTLMKIPGDFPGRSAMHAQVLDMFLTELYTHGLEVNVLAVLQVLFDNDRIYIDQDLALDVLRWGSREMVSIMFEQLVEKGFLINLLHAVATNHCHGDQVMALFLDRKGNEIELTDNLLEQVASNDVCAKEMMEMLMDRRGQEVRITDRVLKNAARNYTPDLLFLLLERRPAEVRITENFLKSALENRFCGLEMMQRLFQDKGRDIEMTEGLLIAAASHLSFGVQQLRLLMDHGGSDDLLTTGTLEAAAKNSDCGREVIELLCSREGPPIPLSNAVLEGAAGNRGQGYSIIEYLLEKRGDEIKDIPDAVLVAAAGNEKGAEILRYLLEKRGDEIKDISDAVLKAAAGNEEGAEILRYLLEKRGDEIKDIPDAVLKAAAGNRQGVEIFRCLLEKRGSEITLSDKVLEIAARSWTGNEIVEYLLGQRGGEIAITDAVLEAAVNNELQAVEMTKCLLEKRGGEITISDRVLELAAKHDGQGNKMVEYLLEKRGGEITVTEAMLMKAAGNGVCGADVMELLLGADSTAQITESIVEKAMDNWRADKFLKVILKMRKSRIPVSAKARERASRHRSISWHLLLMLDRAEAGEEVGPGEESEEED